MGGGEFGGEGGRQREKEGKMERVNGREGERR